MRLMGRNIPLDTSAMLSPVSSVQHWLGHELEIRGIDAVIYTRYILSLLQHDSPDAASDLTEAKFFPPTHRDAAAATSRFSPGGTARGRGGKKAADRRRFTAPSTADELKKTAAVECLLSVSDEESGIESLVDELCDKLKQQATTVSDAFKKTEHDGDQSSSDVTTSSQGDPAQRYYAAFPALSDECDKLKPDVARSEHSLWAKVARMSPNYEAERQPGDGSEVTAPNITSPHMMDKPGSNDADVKIESPRPAGRRLTESSGRRVKFSPPERPGKPRKGKNVEDISGKSLFREGSSSKRQSPLGAASTGGLLDGDNAAVTFLVPKMNSSVKLSRLQNVCRFAERKTGGIGYVLVDGVVNDHTSRACEDQSWYTESWDIMIPLSPIPRSRLYNRSTTPQFEHPQVISSSLPDAGCLAQEDMWKTDADGLAPPGGIADDDTESLLAAEAADHRQLCASIADCEATLEAAFERLYVDDKDVATVNSGGDEKDAKAKGFKGSNSGLRSGQTINTEDVNNVVLDEAAHSFFESQSLSPRNPESFCTFLGEMNESLTSTVCADDKFGSLLEAVTEITSSGCEANSGITALLCTPEMWHSSRCTSNTEGIDNTVCGSCCGGCGDYMCASLLSGTVGHHIPTKNKSIPFSTENEVLDHRPTGLSAVGNRSSVVSPLSHHLVTSSAPSLSEQCTTRVTSCSFSDDSIPQMHQSSECTSVWSISRHDSLAPFLDLTVDCSGTFDGMLTWGSASKEFSSPSQIGNPGIWSMFTSADALGITREEPTWGCYTNDYGSGTRCSPWDLRGFGAWCSSPRQEALVPLSAARISQIWDVNALQRKPDDDGRWYNCSTFADDTHLMNVCFELPDPQSDMGAFIEGGLYGSAGNFCGDSTWSTLTEPLLDTTIGTDHGLWGDFSFEPVFSFHRSISADFSVSPKTKFTGTTEILLSENSAFQDSIPARLPHVQSAPCLSPQKLLRQRMIEHHLVEIRHLYKTDTSILQQLGLTPDGQTDAQVKFSPNKHFKPIHVLTDAATAVTQPVLRDIFDDECPSKSGCKCNSPVCKHDSCLGGYQPFVCDTTEVIEAAIADCSFVPRFRLNKAFEKYSQTGESPQPEYSQDDETFHLPTDMDDLFEDAEDGGSDVTVTQGDCHESSNNCSTSDYESMLQDLSLDDCGSLANLWASETSQPVDIPVSTAYQSIWSCGGDYEIPSIPHCYSTLDAADVPDPSDVFWDLSLLSEFQVSSETLDGGTAEINEAEPEWMNTDDDDDNIFTVCKLELDQQALLSSEVQPETPVVPPTSPPPSPPPPPPLPPDGQVLYSAQLEEEWLKTGEVFEVQVPRKRPTGSTSGPQKKPCSFFLEGNCRRVDCKYSHDLSIITCRFWEEGQCFKGVTCPFLHGYYSGHQQKSREASEEKIRSISVDRDDFPPISKSQDNDNSNSIQPVRGSFHASFPRRVRTRSDRGVSTHANTYQRRRLLTIAKTKSLPA